MTPLPFRRFGPRGPGAPTALVVLCHGLGANGADLITLAPELSRHLPQALFLAPDAPEPCDLVPPEEGGVARQWFSLREWDPEVMAAGAARARPVLDHFLDASLAAHGMDADRYALLGFSQGAMMVLGSGLRRSPPPRVILAYSGILLDPDSLAGELRGRPPVLLAHGAEDDVVPADCSRIAAERLRALSVEVEHIEQPGLGHAIDMVGLSAGGRLLARAFS